MRLFATLALLAAALFWSHPFLPPEPMKAFSAWTMQAKKGAQPPVMVRAPAQKAAPASETAMSSATENSEGLRR